MAFDVHTNMASFTQEEDDDLDDHHRNHQHSLSRLSICTKHEAEDELDNADNGDDFDAGDDDDGGDADEELSDPENIGRNCGGDGGERSRELNFSDSDKEPGCRSLPATPPRRRRRKPAVGGGEGRNSPVSVREKAYASENEAHKGKEGRGRRRRRRLRREYPPWVGSMRRSYEGNGDHGGGVMVVTRAIGGGRALCMDMEEVKACKDLGFELEPGRVSYSAGSTLDTSSGGNSPISNWRISTPGDDPRDVKARLKAWAQAVAFVSTTSRHASS